MLKVGVIYENYKELKDILNILESLQINVPHNLIIVSPSKVYHDSLSLDYLSKYEKSAEVFYIEPPQTNFKELNKFQKLLYSIKVRNAIKHLFDDVGIVVSGIQTVFSRIMFKACREKGILFYVYQRHLLFSAPQTLKQRILLNPVIRLILKKTSLEEFVILRKNVGFADKYFVLGELNKQFLINNKIKSEDIYVTGSLEYDELNLIKKVDSDSLKSGICFVTGAFEWIKDYQGEKRQKYKINALIDYCEKYEKKLTIRVHPRECNGKYQDLQKKHSFLELEYPSSNSILTDLSKFDIIVGWFSTAMFEISLLNSKVLFFILNDDRKECLEIINYLPKDVIVDDINYINQARSIDVSNIISYLPNQSSKLRIVKILKDHLK